MPKTPELQLIGTGSAYLRVSTDKQETERQYQSINSFETRHSVKIADHYWFEDHGWSRDADRERPEFNRLLRLAQKGEVKWIVVDSLDRFGTKNAKRLMGYLADLEEAGCRLYTTDGKEWTDEDDGTEITAWVAGKTSTREQREKSHRVLGGMVAKAKAGEWMGAPPKLGFDVACYNRGTGEELWRVIWEGRDVTGTAKRKGKERPVYFVRRRKVYPDRSEERFDGNVTAFTTTPDTQVLRITPTQDAAKLAAAQKLFARYATEAVTFFDLAKWLNELGIRNSFGNKFQSNDVRKLLSDEAYLGYPTFAKRRNGRFHRHDADGGVTELEPELRGKDTESAPEDVIRSSKRLFEPLVDRSTWDKVQRKLRGRAKKPHAPKNSELYLAGLVICSGCGQLMQSRADRMEYYCGTWDKNRVRGSLADSPCERNGVKQEALEQYITRYLEETKQRLDILKPSPGSDAIAGKLKAQEAEAWKSWVEGLGRLSDYLREHHADEWWKLMYEDDGDPLEEGPFLEKLIASYQRNFDPAAVDAEIKQLDAQHTQLTEECRKLSDPRAIKKTNDELSKLSAQIEALERQREGAVELVQRLYREMEDLSRAISDAIKEMKTEGGKAERRRRAEALRGLLVSIECEFVLTGKKTAGPGNARSKLAAVNFHPIAGDAIIFHGDDGQSLNGRSRDYGNP